MDFFTPQQAARLAQSTVLVDLLFEMQFKSGTGRFWNGNSELVASGETWKPLHGRGAVDGIGHAGSGVSEAVTFTLSGIPDAATGLFADALLDEKEVDQRIVLVRLQLFDDDWQPEGAAIPIWWGFMQPVRGNRTAMTETEGAVQSISMTAENAFFNRARPPHGRYTDRDQQKRYPGDPFFQFTPPLLFKTFVYPDY